MFKIYVNYSGTSLAVKWNAIDSTLEIYFQRGPLKDTSSLKGKRIRGTLVLLFLLQQRSFPFPLRRLQYGLCSCHFPFPRCAKNVSPRIREKRKWNERNYGGVHLPSLTFLSPPSTRKAVVYLESTRN